MLYRSRAPLRCFAFVLALTLVPVPAWADSLQDAVAAILDEAGPGTRWGVVVADADGREVLAIDPEGRFMPASNTKIYTTAAAYFATDGKLDLPGGGNSLSLIPRGRDGADVVLAGHGDARMSDAADCTVDCLSTLADAVAARTRKVHDVIGDDTLFPDQRWSPGMSWNNIATRSGTGISALTLDDNELVVTIAPGPPGSAPLVTAQGYYTVNNLARTVPGAEDQLGYDRMPGSRELVITGTIGEGAPKREQRIGIDDPANFAAWRLAQMLRERGVKVTGTVQTRHRPLMPQDDPQTRALHSAGVPAATAQVPPLAALQTAPLAQDVVITNKVSQNLHAELLLRRIGLIHGTGSIADGQQQVRAMLVAAGVADNEATFYDGSGMSSYNRVAPRGTVRLLTWIARQPWGAEWRESLPVGGAAGTLHRRFSGTALEGRIAAKTGTLNASNALAGYLTAASGRQLVFAVYANDQGEGVSAAPLMDRALEYIAAHE